MATNDNATDNDGLRVTRIRAKNYRSIRELDLELGPLTVLVGPNASGKSNVLDVLRFIRDAISRGLDFAISQRHGMWVIKHRSDCDVEIGFTATIRDLTLDYNFVLTSDPNGNGLVKREYGSYELDTDSGRFVFDIQDGQIIEPKTVSAYLSGVYASASRSPMPLPLEDLLFFKNYLNVAYASFARDAEAQFSIEGMHRGLLELQQVLSGLGFYRVSPDTFRGIEKKSVPSLLDEYGSNLASVLWGMRPNNGTPEDSEELTTEGFRELRDALKHLMPGITDVKSVPVGEYLSLQFKHSNIVPDQDQWFNAAQESDGTLRIFALLTAIYQHRRPSLLGIEEPESAVHPGILTALAEILEEASLRTQIVITTHSPDLIDRLPIECIRAVEFVDGETKVGEVSKTQAEAVKQGLFTTGELHSMEGLRLAGVRA